MEYTFDCSAALGRDDYNQVWLFFSSPDEEDAAVGHTYYIDDLMGPPVRIPENYTITFSISNGDTGGKMSGIPVEINEQVKTSDIQGKADFLLLEGIHSYSISEPGYFPVESTFDLVKHSIIPILLYETTSKLKFRIYSDDLPLSQAEVKVEDAQMFSNAVGIALYKNLPRYKDYSYSVEKQGYQPESGVLVLEGDTTVNVSLQILNSTSSANHASIHIYPNPAKSVLHIESDQLIQRLELLTLLGSLSKNYNIEDHSAILNLSELDHGMYLIKIYLVNGPPLMKRIILSN